VTALSTLLPAPLCVFVSSCEPNYPASCRAAASNLSHAKPRSREGFEQNFTRSYHCTHLRKNDATAERVSVDRATCMFSNASVASANSLSTKLLTASGSGPEPSSCVTAFCASKSPTIKATSGDGSLSANSDGKSIGGSCVSGCSRIQRKAVAGRRA
jgi:hypothetical protein